MASKNNKRVVSIPNVVIWSWMRTVLELCGTELFVFAYLFSQTFDVSHKCYACLADMETWIGATRQTITRNIDNLVKKGFVIKECSKDAMNPIIKHNSYMVDTQLITKMCEESDHDSYLNFLDSYRLMLKQKFPEDGTQIDDYLSELITWHDSKDITVCVRLNELASLIYTNVDDNKSITDVLEYVRKSNKKLSHYPEKSYIEKNITLESPNEVSEPVQNKLFSAEPKKKSKKALKAEWDADKRAMNVEFIMMKVGGNEELAELLDNFLDTDNGRSYTPAQWEKQLDILYRYGRTPERMIEGVNISYMNNYRQLYIIDKTEKDIDLKLSEIDEYVTEQADGNEELKDLLCSYITDVPVAKSCSIRQFKMKLRDLSNLCRTTDEKLASVKRSYQNSYASLAYKSKSNEDVPIDIDRKLDKVHEFIKEGFYHLCDGLEDALVLYVTETSAGRTMTYTKFCTVLDGLRVFCFDDRDKVIKVKQAIQNNADYFAREDFNETKKLKDRLESRSGKADSLDRSRKQKVMMEKLKNPNDSRLDDVPKMKF